MSNGRPQDEHPRLRSPVRVIRTFTDMNEITTSTPSTPARAAGLAPRLAVGALAAGALVVGGSGIVGAIAIKPVADPQVTVVDECVEGSGGRLAVIYNNPDGAGTADFETWVNGDAYEDVSVDPGGQQIQYIPMTEGVAPVVHVTATGGFEQYITKPMTNCWDIASTLVFECAAGGPVVHVGVENTGSLNEGVELTLDGSTIDMAVLAAGETRSWDVPIAEDADWLVELASSHSGGHSSYDHADCSTPQDETSDEVTDQPVVETTTSTTTPTVEVEGATLAAAVSVSPSFTG
jgi:hypothetical protein